MSSLVLPRGMTLRLVALAPGANVSALFFNADHLLERFNMPDTLKAQHTAFLTRGHVLYSDMGRILVSIADDSCGWHDPICGFTDAKSTEDRYGKSSFQKDGNAFFRNGRDNFLIEMGKYGLGRPDLGPCVNFFSKAWVDDSGDIHYAGNHAPVGCSVDIRAEMKTLVFLSNTPHPFNPDLPYAPAPVGLQWLNTGPADLTDICGLSCPENARGYSNTETYNLRTR